MRLLKYILPFVFLATSSCTDLGEFQEEGYKVPCKVVIEANACGITDIGNNLAWLNQLIVRSLNDQSLDYVGRIWVKNYDGQDYLVTDMPLGSGGGNYHTFNCAGEIVTITDASFYKSLTDRDIVWISYCPKPGTQE